MGLPEKYIIARAGHCSASIAKAVYVHIISERQSGYALGYSESFFRLLILLFRVNFNSVFAYL